MIVWFSFGRLGSRSRRGRWVFALIRLDIEVCRLVKLTAVLQHPDWC